MHTPFAFLSAGLLALSLAGLVACGGDDDGDSHAGHNHTPGAETLEARKKTPKEFADLKNPLEASEDVLKRGKASWDVTCGTCHGATGHGDGPAGKGLNPPAAHLSAPEVLDAISDGYIFWRITVGAGPVPGSSMTPYGKMWDETKRWEVVHYLRSLKGK